MAEGFLNMFLEKNDKPVEKVLSAGLNALGGPPTPEAIETMREEDIERQRHYGSFDLDHISSRSLEDKGRMG